MKIIIKLLVLSASMLSVSSFASGLVWDDMQAVQAIKVDKDKFKSCTKGASLMKKGTSGRAVNKELYDESGLFCMDKNDVPAKVSYFTTQELAQEHIGKNAIAVGVMKHRMDRNPGEYQVDNTYIDLYYKVKE